jgi:hypothetical protein
MQIVGQDEARLTPYALKDVAMIVRLAGGRDLADAMMTTPPPFPVDCVRRYLEAVAQQECVAS